MKKILLLAVVIVAAVSSSCFALTLPERLVYSISWTGMKAGTAVQEVKAQGDELHIVSTTRSASWLNPFFPVNDRVESVLFRTIGSGKLGLPKYYKEKINEGRTHHLKEVHFEPKLLLAHTKDFIGRSEKTDPIGPKTYDSLSCVYFLRGIDLVPGRSVFIDIYDCKRLWNTEIKVLRREEITTELGTFKTVVVHPLLKSQGFFARTGEVLVWVTDDALRLPVKMTTKVKIGRITATLVGGSYWPERD